MLLESSQPETERSQWRKQTERQAGKTQTDKQMDRQTYTWKDYSYLVGALSPVNHKRSYQGWIQTSIYLLFIHSTSHDATSLFSQTIVSDYKQTQTSEADTCTETNSRSLPKNNSNTQTSKWTAKPSRRIGRQPKQNTHLQPKVQQYMPTARKWVS